MKTGPVVFLSFSLIFGAAMGWAASPPAVEGQPEILAEKSFTRWPDPVVADCGLFPSLLGKEIPFLRLYALSGGSFHAIPFQVDEKDVDGNLVYTSGERANAADADGRLGKGEELVFMARDSGHRARPTDFPPGIETWEELELKDPLTGGRGWVYLLYSESSPPARSEEDYITYIPVHQCDEGDCNFVKTTYIEDHFYPLKPYFDSSKIENRGLAHSYMSNSPEAGGTGVDYVDRLKVRGTIAFFFGLLKYHLTEKSVTFFESAYKDGPVRLIRNLRIIISLPLGIKAPGAAVDVLWYDTIVDVPMVVDIPFNPGHLYTYLELSIGEDHAPGAVGMKVYNSNNRDGCLVDGRTEGPAETGWNTDLDQWRLMTGAQGTIMNRSFWDERYLEQMEWSRVEYIDDTGRLDPPEDNPGMLGTIVQTNRIEGVKKERYFMYLEWYWPPAFLFSGPGQTYRSGDEKAYLDIADHPVVLRSGEHSMESHYFGRMPLYEGPGKNTDCKQKED
ncbi:hypothetical protein ACFL4G_00420 [Thermodesulfobacteriota bacterium]